MNVSQYSLNEKLANDAIASLSLFASIRESITAAGESATGALETSPDETAHDIAVEDAVLTYRPSEDGGACVLHCSCDASSVAVPAIIEGLPVTSIGGHAFSTCYALEHIDLPGSLSVIGKYAFMNTALHTFEAPRNLRVIGANAFYKCARLKQANLNEGLRTIGPNAFRESALTALHVPASVELIGQNAFKDTALSFCEGGTLDIDGANGHLLLAGGALYASNQGKGLTLIQAVDESLESFEARAGTVFVAGKAFANLRKLQQATFPEGTLGIGDKAFMGCRALTTVGLPDSLRSLGKQVFQDTALRELRIPVSLSDVGVGVFYTGGQIARKHKPTIRSVEISPRNTRFLLRDGILCYRNAHDGMTALLYVGDAEHLVVPREITSIGMYAFLNCSSIKSVEIHDGLESIDVGGLDTGRSITSIIYNVYDGHDTVQERFVVSFPPGQAGREAAKQTFSRGQFSLAYAFEAADDAIFATQDTCLRGKAMLERLRNPVMCRDSTIAAFKRRLRRGVPDTVVAFGKNGFPQGIDLLYEEGVIHDDNIDELIGAASNAGEIAVLSRLLELKRTAFRGSLFDFDL